MEFEDNGTSLIALQFSFHEEFLYSVMLTAFTHLVIHLLKKYLLRIRYVTGTAVSTEDITLFDISLTSKSSIFSSTILNMKGQDHSTA